MLDTERRTVATSLSRVARLTPGRTGNLSVRRGDRFAITPTGIPYEEISPDDVSVVSLDGTHVTGRPPSSEMPLHRRVYDRFETGAVVHVHSPWATTLAVLREPLPPVHYMIVLAGSHVPVAEYATYGTDELASNAVEAMEDADSDACLLANHGLVAKAADVEAALELTETVESLARVYCQARALGAPELLAAEELERTAGKIGDYGPAETGSGEN